MCDRSFPKMLVGGKLLVLCSTQSINAIIEHKTGFNRLFSFKFRAKSLYLYIKI